LPDRTSVRIDVLEAGDAALRDAVLQADRVDEAAIALCSKVGRREDGLHFDIAVG
jgi:hypothetical protein